MHFSSFEHLSSSLAQVLKWLMHRKASPEQRDSAGGFWASRRWRALNHINVLQSCSTCTGQFKMFKGLS